MLYKKLIMGILMSFSGLYLLADADLFSDFNQKYTDVSDSPEAKKSNLELEISNLKNEIRIVRSKSDTNKNDIKGLEGSLATVTLGVADLCGTLSNVNHNNVSICKINLSKNFTQFTFPKGGKILSVNLQGSGRGNLFKDWEYTNSDIIIYNLTTGRATRKHKCEWDLGGKSVKLEVKSSSWNVRHHWQADGAKTYTAKYTLAGRFIQNGKVAGSTNNSNNCIFNSRDLEISKNWANKMWVSLYNIQHRDGETFKRQNLNIRFYKGWKLVFYLINTDVSANDSFRCTQSETVKYTPIAYPQGTGLTTPLKTAAQKPIKLGLNQYGHLRCGNNGTASISIQYDE